MMVRIEIHTYPSNGDDTKRRHYALAFDDFDITLVDAVAAATKRKLKDMICAEVGHDWPEMSLKPGTVHECRRCHAHPYDWAFPL